MYYIMCIQNRAIFNRNKPNLSTNITVPTNHPFSKNTFNSQSLNTLNHINIPNSNIK